MRVYLIAAPENETEGGELAQLLKKRGVQVREEYGKFGFAPAHPGEITLALWSRASMMSRMRMLLTNRAIDAWEHDNLVMARLEHGLSPHGLGDLDMVDLTFAAARLHHVGRLLDALRAVEDRQLTLVREQRAQGGGAPGSGPPPEGSAGGEFGETAPPPVVASRKSAPRARSSAIGGLVFVGFGLALVVAGLALVSRAGVALNGSLIFGALGAGAALLLLIWLIRQRASVKPARRDMEIIAEKPVGVTAPAPSPEPVSEPATFVSYAHANSETVWPLTSQLEAEGVAIWIDRDDLKAGQGWAGTIVRAIKQSGQFCLMCSAESFASDHVRREIYLADKYGKPMLPVRLDDAEMPEDIEYFLIDRQWVDLAGMDMDGQMRALKALFQS